MKLKKNSTHQQTSEYKHPWYEHSPKKKTECCGGNCQSECFHYRPMNEWTEAVPPRPPSPEAVKKAQFVDKTYSWKGE